jgi:hypothetical protein
MQKRIQKNIENIYNSAKEKLKEEHPRVLKIKAHEV